MRALRTHYADEAEFVRRVDEVQRPQGYRLVGAFDENDRCLGVAGFRVIRNLAWGDSLYVDDLSTHPDGRRRGYGRALLEWCMEEGRREGLPGVPPRLRRRPRARGRAQALLQHRSAHHELPLRRATRMIDAAPRMALAAERELEALVGVSSPSGDVEGAEECVALATAFLPTEAEVERLECSTPGTRTRSRRAAARERRAQGAAARASRHRRLPRRPIGRSRARAETASAAPGPWT